MEQLEEPSSNKIVNPEPVDDVESDGEEEEIDMLETWNQVVGKIISMTKESVEASPAFDPASPQTFQSYWAALFARLADEVAADPNVPEYLTAPPIKGFSVSFWGEPAHCGGSLCPCTLGWEPAQVVIRDKEGVTKIQLVEEIGSYLYGETLPTIHNDDGDDTTDAGVVIYASDWMSRGKYVYVHHEDDGPVGKIWMYCCDPKLYKEKKAKWYPDKE